MLEWNTQEIRELFERKAEEKGCSFSKLVKQFVSEINADGNIYIDSSTLRRYLNGEGEPTKGEIRQVLYEKIERDFGYDMHKENDKDAVYHLEDNLEKLPAFCQTYLDSIFGKIYEYIKDAYLGRYAFMYENDFNYFAYTYMLCKPLLPNYICMKLKELLEAQIASVKKELDEKGLILFEGVGVMYKDELEEGEEPNVDFCELTEDYIKNNLELHRKRVCNFFEEIASFWEKKVEVKYTEESTTVKNARERFKKLQEETALAEQDKE